MNSLPHQPAPDLHINLKSCHPERSLVASEANRQAQSKDPVRTDSGTGTARNFRIVVRFFDERESELRPVDSREAAAWESRTRQCRGYAIEGTSPAEAAPSHKRMT